MVGDHQLCAQCDCVNLRLTDKYVGIDIFSVKGGIPSVPFQTSCVEKERGPSLEVDQWILIAFKKA